MTPQPPHPAAFTLRVGYDQDELLGARWWQENLRSAVARRARARGEDGTDESRRTALKVLAAIGGVAAFGFVVSRGCSRGSTTTTVTHDSLALQRERGAYVGSTATLVFPEPSATDAAGGTPSRADLDRLAVDLRPSDPALHPWYLPTLFQSLAAAGNDDLRRDFRMIRTAAMERAFAQGEAVRGLFALAERAAAWTLVVDLPGPEAIAFAAGLQPAADAVFVFDGWPHPRGVVPAHLTLAAAVHYRPVFAAGERPPLRPAVFVLDRDRLSPYRDAPDQFDNRYVAKLPAAAALRARGVERVLYVVPAGAEPQELDDLNAVFVAWRQAGLEVRLGSLGDLLPGPPPPGRAPSARPSYYWHGSPGPHAYFWHHYGWPSQPTAVAPVPPARPVTGSGWAPTRRPTPFDGGALAFGKTRQTHTVPSRSGSWGRSGGGSYG